MGYCFRRTFIKDRTGRLQFNFLPLVSKKSAKSFREKLKGMGNHKLTGSKIEMISELISPMIRGGINYFGKFNPSAMKFTMFCINNRLTKWAMCKYKHLRGRKKRASKWMKKLEKREPNMFPHWVLGFTL